MIQKPLPPNYDDVRDTSQMTMSQLTQPAPSPLPSPTTIGTTTTTKSKLPAPQPITQPAPQLPPPADLSATGGGNGLTSVGQFSPTSNLIGAQITPGATDRMALAKDYFNQFQEATNPAYEQGLRVATQHAAANGRLHSGMLTTDYGNLAESRARDLDLLQRGLLTDATQGSIQDAANARGELRTERGYQNDQSQQAINNAIQQYILQMQIGNAQSAAGQAGNPAGAILGASGNAQAGADQTYAAIAQYLSQLAQQRAAGG